MKTKGLYSYWYPVAVEVQIGLLDGRPYPHDVFLEGHIVKHEVLMCKDSRERLKRTQKADKESKPAERVPNTKICPACLEAWKKDPDSPYYKYVLGKPAKIEVKEVAVVAGVQL